MNQAVLVMAYGTPRSMDELEAYYTDIRRGRPPEPEQLAELRGRYEAIGGVSPLLALTQAQADGIATRCGIPAYVGMKHAEPFVADAVAAMAKDGIDEAVGLVMAPHFSAMSVGDYARRAGLAAQSAGWAGKLRMVDSWHLEPGYIEFLRRKIENALAELATTADETVVIFTAHSLPAHIVDAGDPYPDQLHATADAVAATSGLARYEVAWQSAGRTDAEWLGPDVTDVLRRLAGESVKNAIVCPCGFVADHLEVLYDVDIECKQVAAEAGLSFARTASPNADPGFLEMLANVVIGALDRSR